MTNKQLIDILNKYPPDAKVEVIYDMFAVSDIDDIDYDKDINTISILHDCT